MREVKTTLFLLFFMFFISCKEDVQEHPTTRRIINETIFSIQINIFDDHEEYQYKINAVDTLNISGSCFSGFENYCDIGWFNDNLSANIIFDNRKVLYSEPLIDANQFDKRVIQAVDPSRGYGYVRSNVNGVKIYTYQITQEDYENAEPI